MTRARATSPAAVLAAVALAATVLGLGGATRPADAADAGTRSVFASGAGNRALALGGAYVAVADDAGALLWNPGGLGWVARREFEVSRTGYALGFREEYAAFVLPSWRWGGAAVSFRHFGVDGIEARDDRNQVGDELADAESEITVGFGRALGEAWSLGGAVKLQRQSLGGFSGGGLGADLGLAVRPLLAAGILAPWADRLTWGLALRNIMEPSIRLDRESVADPGTLRTGFAWRGGGLLATADLEKSRDTGPRLHAGLELTPHPLLALRAGVDGGTLTAGAGIRWAGRGFDYVFENPALGPVHRLGLSFPFGRTVLESRQAAERAEGEKLQSLLAEAFQRQQRERMQALLARAESARALGRFDEAFELLATILTLEPEQPEALALDSRCQGENAATLEAGGEFSAAAAAYARMLTRFPDDTVAVAGETRCRGESDRRAARTQSLRRRFALAMDAFGGDDLAGAREGFAAVLASAPADSDAAAMLRRTDVAIARRADLLLREARRDLARGRLEEAASLIEQVAALDRHADGLAQTSAALAQAQRDALTRPANPAAGVPAAGAAGSGAPRTATQARDPRELDDLFRRALTAMKEKRPDDAVRYWELVWSADPGYPRVVDCLKREYLMRGLEAFAAGRLDDAVGHWEKALQVDPNDERARGYLARALKQRARTQEILGAVR